MGQESDVVPMVTVVRCIGSCACGCECLPSDLGCFIQPSRCM